MVVNTETVEDVLATYLDGPLAKQVQPLLGGLAAFQEAGLAYQLSKRQLEALMDEYNANRRRIFEEECITREVGWCAECETMRPKETLQLVFVQAADSRGRITKIQEMCEGCSDQRRDPSSSADSRNGWVYRARDNDGIYEYRQASGWGSIPTGTKIEILPPEHAVGKIGREWGIPPKLYLELLPNCVTLKDPYQAVGVTRFRVDVDPST